MKTLAEISCLTLIAAVVMLCAACSNSNPVEATVEPENTTQPTELDRRIYDPVRVEHRGAMGYPDDDKNLIVSTGAITANTHEQITIIQSQVVDPPATGGQLIIQWDSVIDAYNLTTEDAIERPPE